MKRKLFNLYSDCDIPQSYNKIPKMSPDDKMNNICIRKKGISSCSTAKKSQDKLVNSKLVNINSSESNGNFNKFIGYNHTYQSAMEFQKETETSIVKKHSSQITPKMSKTRRKFFSVESPSALLRQRLSFANIETFEEEEEEAKKDIPHRIPYNELLKGIHVYVEVRDGVDNRSVGIKTILRSMGATVHDNLNKKVTHVIFRQGLTRTYNKAIELKAHLLSILWVEAVRSEGHLVPESLYPANDLEMYSSPVSSKKFQKIKSMQPDYDNSREKELERKVRKSFYRASISSPSTELSRIITTDKKEEKQKKVLQSNSDKQKNELEHKVRKSLYQSSLTDFTNKLVTNIILSEKVEEQKKSYVKCDDTFAKNNVTPDLWKKQDMKSSTTQSVTELTDITNGTSVCDTKNFQRRKSIRLLNKNKSLKKIPS